MNNSAESLEKKGKYGGVREKSAIGLRYKRCDSCQDIFELESRCCVLDLLSPRLHPPGSSDKWTWIRISMITRTAPHRALPRCVKEFIRI